MNNGDQNIAQPTFDDWKKVPDTIGFRLDDEHKMVLSERARMLKMSVHALARHYVVQMLHERDERHEIIRPINQAIFRMVSLLLLNEPEQRPGGGENGTTQSNWIFLDEIREIGKLQGYHELANKGRSKGVRREALRRGLPVVGTVGVLEKAAERNLINLSEAFSRLARTSFYVAPEVLRQALQRDAANRNK